MNKKIYTSFKGLLIIYLPVYFLVAIIFYLIMGITFPPTLYHYLAVGIWTITTIIYLIFGYKSSYYEIGKHELIHHKGKQVLYYPYKDIIYIDENYSSKKLSIRFVTRKGDERYLAHDPQKLVYQAMLAKVEPYWSIEEINKAFPKLKL
ncbi:MAG: hypothetical protein RBS24_01795 [Bacilli bacterium]|nr:hypothetical protein [Bacilli bacterium]